MVVILASSSPRRKELLARIIPEFDCQAADIDESIRKGQTPIDYVQEMAERKAFVIHQKNPNALTIACDTIVALEHEIFGKPKDRKAAYTMLKKLSGCTHQVLTSVVIRKGSEKTSFLSTSEVTFFPLSEKELVCYLATDEYKDKAGAYGIQGAGALLVKSIQGDYYSIMGLPIAQLSRKLTHYES